MTRLAAADCSRRASRTGARPLHLEARRHRPVARSRPPVGRPRGRAECAREWAIVLAGGAVRSGAGRRASAGTRRPERPGRAQDRLHGLHRGRRRVLRRSPALRSHQSARLALSLSAAVRDARGAAARAAARGAGAGLVRGQRADRLGLLQRVRADCARACCPTRPNGDPFGPIPPWIGWAACAGGDAAGAQLLAARTGRRAQAVLAAAGGAAAGGKPLGVREPFLAGSVLALPIVLKVTPLVPVGLVVFQQFVAAWHGSRSRAAWRAPARLVAGDRWPDWRCDCCWCRRCWSAGGRICIIWKPGGRRSRCAPRPQHDDDLAGDSTRPATRALPTPRTGWATGRTTCSPAAPTTRKSRRARGPGLVMDRPLVDRVAGGSPGWSPACCCWRSVIGRGRGAMTLWAELAASRLACAVDARAVPDRAGQLFRDDAAGRRVRRGQWLARAQVADGGPPLRASCRRCWSCAHYVLFDFAGRVGLLGPRHDGVVCRHVGRDAATRASRGRRRPTRCRRSPGADRPTAGG